MSLLILAREESFVKVFTPLERTVCARSFSAEVVVVMEQGYFACIAGNVSSETIKRSIEAQKTQYNPPTCIHLRRVYGSSHARNTPNHALKRHGLQRVLCHAKEEDFSGLVIVLRWLC